MIIQKLEPNLLNCSTVLSSFPLKILCFAISQSQGVRQIEKLNIHLNQVFIESTKNKMA